MASQSRGLLQPQGCWIRASRKNSIHDRDARILGSDSHLCVWCLKALLAEDYLARQDRTLDHLITRRESAEFYGYDSPHAGKLLPDGRSINISENLITACKSCNSQRADTDWLSFTSERPGSLDRIKAILAEVGE